jgi:HSP20 family molecular chaperone IbpA
MSTLVPLRWRDLSDLLDLDVISPESIIRMEDDINDTEYTVRAELPGVDPEKDVKITVDHGVLTIQSERRAQTQARHRTEFRYGMMQRSVRLPGNAEEDAVTARYDKGILEVIVPLRAAPAPKVVPIATTE